jgi:hypothetical protein
VRKVTRIHDFQTHNLALVKSYTQFAVSLGTDGEILSQGTLVDALVQNQSLLVKAALDHELIEKAQQEMKAGSPVPVGTASGKLVVEEEIDIGRVSWPSSMLPFPACQCSIAEDCRSASLPPRIGWWPSVSFLSCLHPRPFPFKFFYKLSNMVSRTMGRAV